MRPPLVVAAAALAGALGVAGCIDLGLVSDIVFAPTVPGLPADQPWVSLPVGAWVTEGGIRADAMAGCFAAACKVPAAVGLFTAAGSDGRAVASLAADPARLARFLSEPRKPDPRAARGKGTRPARPKVDVAVQRLASAEGTGFLVRMTRADGVNPAFGVVIARPNGGATTFVLVVSVSEETARRLAQDVAARMG